MTPRQIAMLPEREIAPVIIPVGAIEQHGPHLPVAVDSFLAQVWVEQIVARLDLATPCYIAPPITVGKSNEHTGFPGTLSISKQTLRAQLLATARQLHSWGFSIFAVLNTHGGNLAVITYTLREIRALFGLRAGYLASGATPGVSPQEATYGYHANEVETALLLATAPGLVRINEATCEYCAHVCDTEHLRPERAPATFAWVAQDLSPNGIMGDATLGTVEKGEKWLDAAAEGYARHVTALAAEARVSRNRIQ